MRGFLTVAVLGFAQAGAGPESATEWRDGEYRVMAYVASELREIRVEDPTEERELADPFGDDAALPNPGEKPDPKPVRLESPPQVSRFFREGDELWEVSAILRAAKVIESAESWAVFNDTTRRLVVNGTGVEHARCEGFQGRWLYEGPRHLQMTMRLLKVRSREIDGVKWTIDLVKERLVEEVLAVSTRSMAGSVARVAERGDGYEVSLESEMDMAISTFFLDARMTFEARLGEALGGVDLRISSALTFDRETPLHLEMGSKDDPEQTFLLETAMEVQSADGTPEARWQEYEDPRHQPPPGFGGGYHEVDIKEQGGGFFLGRWQVPAGFSDELVTEGEDPFGEAEPDDKAKGEQWVIPRREFPKIDVPDRIAGMQPGEVVLDLSAALQGSGIEIAEGGWIYYLPRKSEVMARLDAANISLLDLLLEEL